MMKTVQNIVRISILRIIIIPNTIPLTIIPLRNKIGLTGKHAELVEILVIAFLVMGQVKQGQKFNTIQIGLKNLLTRDVTLAEDLAHAELVGDGWLDEGIDY